MQYSQTSKNHLWSIPNKINTMSSTHIITEVEKVLIHKTHGLMDAPASHPSKLVIERDWHMKDGFSVELQKTSIIPCEEFTSTSDFTRWAKYTDQGSENPHLHLLLLRGGRLIPTSATSLATALSQHAGHPVDIHYFRMEPCSSQSTHSCSNPRIYQKGSLTLSL